MWDQEYKRKAPERIENSITKRASIEKKLSIEVPDISKEVARAEQVLKTPPTLGDIPKTSPDELVLKVLLRIPLSREEKVLSKMILPPDPNDPLTSEEKTWIRRVIPGIDCPCLDE